MESAVADILDAVKAQNVTVSVPFLLWFHRPEVQKVTCSNPRLDLTVCSP